MNPNHLAKGAIILALVYRAHTSKSLTPAGILVAVITATIHAVHPWNLPFALLISFYLVGNRATKVRIPLYQTPLC